MNSSSIPIAHNISYVNLCRNNAINKSSINNGLAEYKKTVKVFTQVLKRNPGSITHPRFLFCVRSSPKQ